MATRTLTSTCRALYGLLKKDLTVLVPNATGILAGLFGVISFHRFTRSPPVKLYLAAAAIAAAAVKLFTDGSASSIGLIGCGLAVVLSGSPLATVSTVIKEKSTAALPFLNSFTTWLNGLTWLLYGSIIAHDVMIWGPNLMGFVLGSVQMMLYFIYGMPPPKNKHALKPFVG